MPFGILHHNVLKEHNDELRRDFTRYKNLHIYKFDETLFKTPLPNPYMFSHKAINLFTKNVDPLSEMNWYTNFLPFKKIDLKNPKYWNQSVIKMIELSTEDPETLVMVFVTRVPKLFKTIVRNALMVYKGLDKIIDLLIFDEQEKQLTNMVKLLLNEFKQIEEVTYYSSNDPIAHGKTFFQNVINDHVELNEFQIAKQTTVLSPPAEITVMKSMLQRFNAKSAGHSNMRLSKSILGCYYKLPIEEIALLHKEILPLFAFHDRDFKDRLEDRRFTLQSSMGIMISKSQVSQKVLSGIGGLGEEVKLGVVSFGYIKDEIYAVKVISNHERVKTTMKGNELFIIVCKKKQVPIERVRKIRKWYVTPKMLNLSSFIEYRTQLDLKVDRSF